jgi:F0F1-type ATP synthase assembly protein I
MPGPRARATLGGREEVFMSTLSHHAQEKPALSQQLLVPEMWASLAIAVMWAAVVIAAIWGPDFVSTSAGGNSTTIPSAVALAPFAFGGSWVVAKYAFRR